MVFCETFLSYVRSHPMLQRAMVSSLSVGVLPTLPTSSCTSFLPSLPPWLSIPYWEARPQHALTLALLTLLTTLASATRSPLPTHPGPGASCS